MILDHENLFSDSQEVLVTGVSENVIDTREDHDYGAGEPIYLVIAVTDGAVGGTSMEFAIETSDVEDFATKSTLYSSGAVPAADLGSGSRPVAVALPRGAKRFLRLAYTAVGAFTAGTYVSGLVSDVQDNRVYPIRSTITG